MQKRIDMELIKLIENSLKNKRLNKSNHCIIEFDSEQDRYYYFKNGELTPTTEDQQLMNYGICRDGVCYTAKINIDRQPDKIMRGVDIIDNFDHTDERWDYLSDVKINNFIKNLHNGVKNRRDYDILNKEND